VVRSRFRNGVGLVISEAPASRVLVSDAGTLVRILTLASYEVGPWHWHSKVSDQTLCLEGTLLIDIRAPDATFELRAGSARVIEVPAGQVHRVRNPGSQLATYLLIQHGGLYDFKEDGN